MSLRGVVKVLFYDIITYYFLAPDSIAKITKYLAQESYVSHYVLFWRAFSTLPKCLYILVYISAIVHTLLLEDLSTTVEFSPSNQSKLQFLRSKTTTLAFYLAFVFFLFNISFRPRGWAKEFVLKPWLSNSRMFTNG